MPTFLRLFAIPLTVGCAILAADARAADTVVQTAVPLVKARKSEPRGGGPLDKVEVGIWLPDGVTTIRGAICNPFYLKAVEQKHWQEAARLWGFAVIGANYFSVDAKEFAPTIQKALDEFAEKTGHKELENIPFCWVGMSAGAGMSMKFADAMPDRTIAVGPVCLEVGPSTPETRKIPTLTVFGEKDGQQMKILGEKLPAQRKEGAQWATAVQWGRGHEFALANNLLLPFFDDVIRRRLPADAGKGSVKLNDCPPADVWLGDPATWGKSPAVVASAADFKGDRDAACWFPTGRVAKVWSAFVGNSKSVTIATPPGQGDGQPFEVHSSDAVLPVKVEVSGPEKVTKVELFDGDVLLGSRDVGPFTFEPKFAPGVHALIAVVTIDGKALCSRPHAIVVNRR